MRFILLLATFVCAISTTGCRGPGEKKRTDRDGIDLSQTVTRNPRAENGIFKNFKDNWRQFINTSPELALPVTVPPNEPVWQPQVASECLFSADAGAVVSQVTVSWNESDDPEAQPIRLDLALHHNGFGRNYYSTALPSGLPRRFNLPPNSSLIRDPEAVLLTGPGLFPLLMDFKTVKIEDPATHRRFRNRTIVLRDLAPGLTYTIRVCRLGKDEWGEEKRSVFVTPVCPNSF